MDKRVQDAPCGILSLNLDGIILEANPRFRSWMMFDEKDLLGKSLDILLSKASKMLFHTYFYPTLHVEGTIEEFFIYLTNQAGDSIPFLLNANEQIRNEETVIEIILIQMKKRIHYEMELRTIQENMKKAYQEQENAYDELTQLHQEIQTTQEELIEMNQELIKLSNTDKLTLLPNRHYFENELTHQINLWHHYQKPLSLAMLDIDHFKKVNDTYGHLTGDQVLASLATLLKNDLPKKATLARYGGEEFICILPNHSLAEATEIGQGFIEKTSKHSWELVPHLTISVGVAMMQSKDTKETFLERADQALYASKNNGRNQVTSFSS